MRYPYAVLVAVALAFAGCQSASPSPQAALAQSGYQPTVRAATDAAPGQEGPVEIIGFAFPPNSPLMLKAGVIWDGTRVDLTPGLPVSSASTACPTVSAACAPSRVYTSPCAPPSPSTSSQPQASATLPPPPPPPPGSPNGTWVWHPK